MNAKKALTIILIVIILALGGYFVFRIINKPVAQPGIVQVVPGLQRTISSGKVASISQTEIAVATDVGIENFGLDANTKITDDKGDIVDASYLVPGIQVGITNKNKVADTIVISELPSVVISTPSSLNPVEIKFNVEGYVHPMGNSIKVSVSNTRTAERYLEDDISLPSGLEYYKKFTLTVDLKTASDIMDGDNVKVSVIQADQAKDFVFTYKGGMMASVKVPFLKGSKCGSIVLKPRLIAASRPSVRTTIEEAMLGPVEAEAKEGLKTAFPGMIRINRFQFDNDGKNVIIDFSKELLPSLKDGCAAKGMKSQVETILKELSITAYEVKVDGNVWFKK